MHNWTAGEEITAEKLNDVNPGASSRISQTERNILELLMENYFAGKNTPYQGLWFDGFSDLTKVASGSGSTSGITNSGQNQITLASSAQAESFTVGNGIEISDGTNEEFKVITDIISDNLIVDSNLTHSYGNGSNVKEMSATIDVVNKKLVSGNSSSELVANPLYSDPSLVSYYRMEGNSNDSKGGNNGTDTAMTYGSANGKYGQGAGFNGSSLINLGNSSSLNLGHITISFWLQIGSLSADSVAASKWESPGGSWFIYIDGSGASGYHNKIRFHVSTDNVWGNMGRATSDNELNIGVWYHIVCTYDGSAVKMYINGQLQAESISPAVLGNIFSNSSNVKISSWTSSNSNPLPNGSKIDDFAIFSRALTASEVANMEVVYGSRFFYQSKKIYFPQAKSHLKLWLARKIVVSSNLLEPVIAGTNTFVLAGDITGKIKAGDCIEIRDAAGTMRERLTIESFVLSGGNTSFSTVENFAQSYTTADFVERVDFLPKVSLSDIPTPYVSPILVQSLPSAVDGEMLTEDEYEYSSSVPGHNLSVQVMVSRNDTSLNPYAKRLGVAVSA